MSLVRRLRRIARAQLGSLRGDPFDDGEAKEDESSEPPAGNSATASKTEGNVPPEVAKAYRALEVPVGSDRETVKQGYRRVMKKYHQDKFENDTEKRPVAGEVSKRLNVAYDRVLEYLDANAA